MLFLPEKPAMLANVDQSSLAARDRLAVIHPQTNLDTHMSLGAEIISRGEGIYVFDAKGQKFLESAAGLWCASLGFSNDRLAAAAEQQMRSLGFYHNYWHTGHERSIELAEALLALAPVPMARVLFQNSGSEANDTAIKLAWYYWSSRDQLQRRKIIGRERGYHGSTIATASAGGKPDLHKGFNLPLPGFLYADAPYYFRHAEPGETEEEYSSRLARRLEAMILAEGPETIAAFIAEPVIGAGGALLPPAGYFSKIQSVLRKYDILFIADEVICGFGRTGAIWGSQTYGIRPDLITCAKALSAGMQPISALLIGARVYEAMLERSRTLGTFAHGITYSGHPVACAVSLEVLRIYREMDLIKHVALSGGHLQRALTKVEASPLVAATEGVGLIAGIELQEDSAYGAAIGQAFMRCARMNGLIVRAIGNRIAISPPLIITPEQVDEMIAMIVATLKDLEAGA